MNQLMALPAYGNQVLLGVVAGVAAELFVMEFESGHCAARLASPPITTKHLVTELFVELGIKPQARLLRSDLIHDAFSFTWCRNVRLSSPERNLKNRKADCRRSSGFSFPRFAPARKSALIISRQ
jgi:hypothetical protein